MLSYALWKSRFGGNPKIVGSTIQLDGQPYLVVGVIGKSFVTDTPTDLYLPFQFDLNTQDQAHYFMVAARLKPGITIRAGKCATEAGGGRVPAHLWAEGDGAAGWVRRGIAGGGVGWRFAHFAVGADGRGGICAADCVRECGEPDAGARDRTEAGAGDARGAGRRTRNDCAAVADGEPGAGADRRHAGAGAGRRWACGCCWRWRRLTFRMSEKMDQRYVPDMHVLLFTLGVSVLTGILFGLAPAISASRPNLVAALNESSSRSGVGFRTGKLRSALVMSEMALALILVIGAALLIRTFMKLQAVDPGYDTRNVLTMAMSISGDRFQKTAGVAQLVKDGTDKLTALPGVDERGGGVLPAARRRFWPALQHCRAAEGRRSFYGRRRIPDGVVELLQHLQDSAAARPHVYRAGQRCGRRAW